MKNKLVFNAIDMDLLERTMWKEKKLINHTIRAGGEKKKKNSIIEDQKEKSPQGIKKEQPQKRSFLEFDQLYMVTQQ